MIELRPRQVQARIGGADQLDRLDHAAMLERLDRRERRGHDLERPLGRLGSAGQTADAVGHPVGGALIIAEKAVFVLTADTANVSERSRTKSHKSFGSLASRRDQTKGGNRSMRFCAVMRT